MMNTLVQNMFGKNTRDLIPIVARTHSQMVHVTVAVLSCLIKEYTVHSWVTPLTMRIPPGGSFGKPYVFHPNVCWRLFFVRVSVLQACQLETSNIIYISQMMLSTTFTQPCSYGISPAGTMRTPPIVSRPSWVGFSWKVGRSTSHGYAHSTRCEKMWSSCWSRVIPKVWEASEFRVLSKAFQLFQPYLNIFKPYLGHLGWWSANYVYIYIYIYV